VSSSDLLSIEVRPGRRRLVLVLRGELDHFTAEAARASVEMALADGWEQVVIDLSALSFMDAGGVNLLFALRNRAAEGVISMVEGGGEAARMLRLIPGPPPLPQAHVRPAEPPGFQV